MFLGEHALYMSDAHIYIQPVKVVSSMGQQSVGKSFSLNHFLDTSFAGSAMRTTGMLVAPSVITCDYTEVNRGCVDVRDTHR